MNVEKEISLIQELLIWRQMYETKNFASLPSKREAAIQNAKLLRMITEVPGYLRSKLIPNANSKTIRKAQGRRSMEIGAQARKVRQIHDQLIKEFLRGRIPSITNKQYQYLKNDLHKNIADKIKLHWKLTSGPSPKVFDKIGAKP